MEPTFIVGVTSQLVTIGVVGVVEYSTWCGKPYISKPIKPTEVIKA